MTTPILSATNLSVTYGAVKAVINVDLELHVGTITGLIGPNGAGKTTIIDALSGFVRHEGTVEFDGASTRGRQPYELARCGLVRTFQSLELFEDLTVEENLMAALPRGRAAGRGRRPEAGRVTQVLDAVALGGKRHSLPLVLSNGQRKRLAVARSLAQSPRMLLLDEPAAGLDAHESLEFGRNLRNLLSPELGMLLIDHDMGLINSTCDYVYVLDFGQRIAAGPPDVVRSDPKVIAAYLGGSAPVPRAENGGEKSK